MRIRLPFLWDNHITRHQTYGMTIEETKLAPNLFPSFPPFFLGDTAPQRCLPCPIFLTLPQLPTSLVRLQKRWRRIASSRAVQN
jgi:hypothetical protein